MKRNIAVNLGALALTIGAIVAPSIAHADVITFGPAIVPTLATPYLEAGYTVDGILGNWFGTGYGNPGPSIYISSPADSIIRITKGGAAFSFDSFDYSCNFGPGAFNVTGFNNGNQTFAQSGPMVASLPPSFGFTTQNSTNPGAQMTSLFIEVFPGGGTSSINLDNITLHGGVVPEPATMALLGLGLAGLIGRRRANKS